MQRRISRTIKHHMFQQKLLSQSFRPHYFLPPKLFRTQKNYQGQLSCPFLLKYWDELTFLKFDSAKQKTTQRTNKAWASEVFLVSETIIDYNGKRILNTHLNIISYIPSCFFISTNFTNSLFLSYTKRFLSICNTFRIYNVGDHISHMYDEFSTIESKKGKNKIK